MERFISGRGPESRSRQLAGKRLYRSHLSSEESSGKVPESGALIPIYGLAIYIIYVYGLNYIYKYMGKGIDRSLRDSAAESAVREAILCRLGGDLPI